MKLRTRALSLALVCLAFGPIACDDSASSPSPASQETRFIGDWKWAINVTQTFFTFREAGQGTTHFRNSTMIRLLGQDSLNMTWSASGGNLRLITEKGDTSTGTYRFFGRDSVELRSDELGTGLLLRTATIPD